jgi:protein NirF
VTPDGRYYLAGLFGEDGVALLDTWRPEQGTRRILGNYGRGQEKLPVFKMPHLRGWSMAQGNAYLPAIGRHEVLGRCRQQLAGNRPHPGQGAAGVRHGAAGWPAGVGQLRVSRQRLGRGDRYAERQVVKTLAPGKAILHMEFTPRGEQSGFPPATTTGW